MKSTNQYIKEAKEKIINEGKFARISAVDLFAHINQYSDVEVIIRRLANSTLPEQEFIKVLEMHQVKRFWPQINKDMTLLNHIKNKFYLKGPNKDKISVETILSMVK